jgi:phosphonate transport system substrate-binding protein
MIEQFKFLFAAAVLFAVPAHAQDWKAKYPELVMAAAPAENPTAIITRWLPVADYLSHELGVKVTIRPANDYAAVIEGQRAGNIHIAQYGGAGYARAVITGVRTEPFLVQVNSDGSKGYYSVFFVKKDSPYRTIADLKGRNLALVDPNSTSGNNVPRFELNKMGITPETFFKQVVYAGSHENGIIALQNGTVDVAADSWTNETDSNLMRMVRKGLVKYDDFRMIHKSDLIMNPLLAFLSNLPDDLKAKIGEAFLQLPVKNKALFDGLYDGQKRPWEPVDRQAYEPTINLIKFVDELRKKKRGS